jgi:hypothetical protein
VIKQAVLQVFLFADDKRTPYLSYNVKSKQDALQMTQTFYQIHSNSSKNAQYFQ